MGAKDELHSIQSRIGQWGQVLLEERGWDGGPVRCLEPGSYDSAEG